MIDFADLEGQVGSAMKMTMILLAASVAICSAQSGSQSIIKQRAKDLRDQSNARQGVPPPASSPAPQPQPAVRPATATPAATSMSRFQAGLAAIKQGTPVTAEQQQKLAAELAGMAQGTKPSFVTVDNLAKELSSALAEKQLSASARARLVQDLDGLLNPAKYPQAKVPAIIEDIQSIFTANGLDRKRAGAIADLAKAISGQVQPTSR
jgi:hypothetical protein